jgi:Domain of unknown function (DUF4145)
MKRIVARSNIVIPEKAILEKVRQMSMDPTIKILWPLQNNIRSKDYTCGYCNSPLASEKGYIGELGTGVKGERVSGQASIYICHQCTRPTFFDRDGEQTPGVSYGRNVAGIDDASVKDLYEEARRAMSVNSYTATILCCRKLLMHIAVAKGAPKNKAFTDYVDYLASQHYVPPDAKDWVDHIRKKGNEANHEIDIMPRSDAQELLDFIGMLLTLIYQFPATMRKKHPPSQAKEE